MNKPLIIEALEEIGPCDINTLACHLGQSAGIVNSMLIKFMRSGQVKSADGVISLAEGVMGIPITAKAPEESVIDSNAVVPSEVIKPSQHPWRIYPDKKATTVVSKADAEVMKVSGESQPKPVAPTVNATPAVDPLTTAVQRPCVKDAVSNGVSKAERLRNLLRENGGEMSSGEMATSLGIVQNSISGILCGSVLSGLVEHIKRDGRSFYKWRGEQPVKAQDTSLQSITTDVFVSDNASTAEKPNAVVGASFSPKAEQSITVPASVVLEKECYQLDSELIAVNERLQLLKAKREHKHALLEMVKKLEEHLEVAPDDAA